MINEIIRLKALIVLFLPTDQHIKTDPITYKIFVCNVLAKLSLQKLMLIILLKNIIRLCYCRPTVIQPLFRSGSVMGKCRFSFTF